MNQIELLEKTKTAFMTYQIDGNRYHYPETLKKDAVWLLDYYSPSKLSRELGVSVKSLKNWRDISFDKKTPESATFVPLVLDKEVNQLPSRRVEAFRMKLPHQLELILPIQSRDENVEFICSLIKGMSECSI